MDGKKLSSAADGPSKYTKSLIVNIWHHINHSFISYSTDYDTLDLSLL